jgi:hypothetical protein
MPKLRLLRVAFLPLAMLAALLVYLPLFAQGEPVTVPNVTGLSVPAAAALLNRNGMVLGRQSEKVWTEGQGQPVNTIVAQSLSPGSTVERSTALDVTVLRSPNVLLVYQLRVFTLINQADGPIDLRGLVFNALDGNTPASFPATNWMPTLDGGGRCAQLWAEPRTGPDRPAECTGVQRWLSTVNPSVHFWTGLNSVTSFSVVYDGVERTVCEGAASGQGLKQCAFYLPAGTTGGDTTDYVYLAYTTDRLIVLNQSDDQWMPLAQTKVYNRNPNLSVPEADLTIGDPQLFNNPDIVANIARLAPGQCLLFTNSGGDGSPPQPCDVIAQLDINPTLIFWAADFDIGSTTDGRRHSCPAATADKMTICVMPR